MKKHRLNALTVVVLMLTLLAIGCSSNNQGKNESNVTNTENQPKTTTNTEEPKDVTLRFATWDSTDGLKTTEAIAKKFEEAHPGVKVQVEAYGDGFDQKLAASFGASNPPDVVYMWDFPTYHLNLEPLDVLMDGDASLELDDFYDDLFNYTKVDGNTYGIPTGFTSRVVYYNKKLFDAAGAAYPTAGWTWDDFREAAKKLTDPSKKQYGFGIRAENDPYDLQGFVWSNGGSFISPDGKAIEGFMNGPETVEAVQMFGTMLKDKYAVLVGGKNQQSGNDVFKAGKIAMWESGVWPLEGFKEAKMDFGTVEIPTFAGKLLKGVLAESAISITKDSQNKEIAWEFVKFMISKEIIMTITSDLPVRKSVVLEKNLEQDPLYAPFYKMLATSKDTPAFLMNMKWKEVNRYLSSAIDAVMLGQDAKEVLDNAVKDGKKFIQ